MASAQKVWMPLLFSLLLSMILLPLVNSSYSDESDGTDFKFVSGKYENPKTGLRIVIPENFIGIVGASPGLVEILIIVPGDTSFSDFSSLVVEPFIVVGTSERSSEAATSINPSDTFGAFQLSTCEISDNLLSIKKLNSMTAIQFSDAYCVYEDSESTLQTHILATKKYYITSLYNVPTDADSSIKSSLKSFSVKGAVDLSKPTELMKLFGLKMKTKNFTVEGKTVKMEYGSSASIKNLSFDGKTKEMGFVATAPGEIGAATIINIGKVLSEPYFVSVDGDPIVDDVVIKDRIQKQTFLVVNHEPGSHKITIGRDS